MGLRNQITLVWVPGHSGINGNDLKVLIRVKFRDYARGRRTGILNWVTEALRDYSSKKNAETIGAV